ncbi:unnamed protein product [Vitrella brassicaformis CCMP3155]|uniref:C3H1-type domain-containing protein n=1 Tax=Vitrella brassicaformis (strain CCMP3155) TaxID=1169540 RepID=A0A0G4ENX0_VITBC|nr:unnamed protein product [Vitrella brassicaformis CCMP3155]|eukprot:CEL99141.1 unnamed protein product [Vitrella brassicaformis CCMP3155]
MSGLLAAIKAGLLWKPLVYKTYDCNFFHTPGGCYRGGACIYAHGVEERRTCLENMEELEQLRGKGLLPDDMPGLQALAAAAAAAPVAGSSSSGEAPLPVRIPGLDTRFMLVQSAEGRRPGGQVSSCAHNETGTGAQHVSEIAEHRMPTLEQANLNPTTTDPSPPSRIGALLADYGLDAQHHPTLAPANGNDQPSLVSEELKAKWDAVRPGATGGLRFHSSELKALLGVDADAVPSPSFMRIKKPHDATRVIPPQALFESLMDSFYSKALNTTASHTTPFRPPIIAAVATAPERASPNTHDQAYVLCHDRYSAGVLEQEGRAGETVGYARIRGRTKLVLATTDADKCTVSNPTLYTEPIPPDQAPTDDRLRLQRDVLQHVAVVDCATAEDRDRLLQIRSPTFMGVERDHFFWPSYAVFMPLTPDVDSAINNGHTSFRSLYPLLQPHLPTTKPRTHPTHTHSAADTHAPAAAGAHDIADAQPCQIVLLKRRKKVKGAQGRKKGDNSSRELTPEGARAGSGGRGADGVHGMVAQQNGLQQEDGAGSSASPRTHTHHPSAIPDGQSVLRPISPAAHALMRPGQQRGGVEESFGGGGGDGGGGGVAEAGSVQALMEEERILRLALQELQRRNDESNKRIETLEHDKQSAEDNAVLAQNRYDKAWEDPKGTAWTNERYCHVKRALYQLESPVRRTKSLTKKLKCSSCNTHLWDHVIQPCGHLVCGACQPEDGAPCPICHTSICGTAQLTLPYTTDDLPTMLDTYENAVDEWRKAKADGPPAHPPPSSLGASAAQSSQQPAAEQSGGGAVAIRGRSPRAAKKSAPKPPAHQKGKASDQDGSPSPSQPSAPQPSPLSSAPPPHSPVAAASAASGPSAAGAAKNKKKRNRDMRDASGDQKAEDDDDMDGRPTGRAGKRVKKQTPVKRGPKAGLPPRTKTAKSGNSGNSQA